jgi:type IV pilus assembly protein PilM
LEELPDPEEFDPENPPESLVVMSMGTDTTDLIVTNGIKLWLRNIPIGGNHFTKQLSRELKLTQAKAEHLKRNARQAENPKAVFKAMRPVFNDLVNEVQRSLTFFQSMDKTAGISKLVLLGNAAKLPGLRQYLNKQLELDIAKISDFQNLTGPDVVGQKSFTDNLLSFAPCYGLCLQGLKRGQINTNLLPQEIVVERIVRAKKPWALASVGALMLGCLLGYFFQENAWWQVNDNFKLNGVSWSEAKTKVSNESSTSSRFVEEDKKQKDKLDKLDRLAKELTSASEGKSAWIEILSAIYQALPNDDYISQLPANERKVDPQKYGFKDRQEIYIDYIDTKYYPDLGVWHAATKPIHDTMLIDFVKQLKQDELAENATAKGAAEKSVLESKPGWVIEIRGHHFHNSEQQVMELNSDFAYLTKSFLGNLLEGEVEMPTADGGATEKFKFTDFGLYFPTRVADSSPVPAVISYVLEQNRNSAPGASETDDQTGDGTLTFNVKRYDFTIQMAWIPRSPEERQKLKETRLAEEQAKLDAEAKAAENTTEPN